MWNNPRAHEKTRGWLSRGRIAYPKASLLVGVISRAGRRLRANSIAAVISIRRLAPPVKKRKRVGKRPGRFEQGMLRELR
jgi:hypothetical protein